jgi:hypothetical protein
VSAPQRKAISLKSIIAGGPVAPALEEEKASVMAPAVPVARTLKDRAHQMSVYLEPPVYDQLRDLGYIERKKLHGLMLEALDMLFAQRGLRSIDELLASSEAGRQ